MEKINLDKKTDESQVNNDAMQEEIDNTDEIKSNINLTKEEEKEEISDKTDNQSSDKVEVFGQTIDMNEVHSKEQDLSQKATDGLNQATAQVDEMLNKVNNGINNFIDNIGKQNNNGQQFNNNGQQFNNNGQQFNNNDVVTPDKLKVEPALAAVLSVLLIGLGQMINGQIYKGLAILLGTIAAVVLTCGILGLLAPVVLVFSALDAYKCAEILQKGGTLGQWEFHIFN